MTRGNPLHGIPQPSTDCSDVFLFSPRWRLLPLACWCYLLCSMATIIIPASACWDLQGAQAWLDSCRPSNSAVNFLLARQREVLTQSTLLSAFSVFPLLLYKDYTASTYGFATTLPNTPLCCLRSSHRTSISDFCSLSSFLAPWVWNVLPASTSSSFLHQSPTPALSIQHHHSQGNCPDFLLP